MTDSTSHKILVIGPSWVGDMVLSQSLYIILKEKHPDVAIDVMAPSWSHPLLARIPQVSASITLPFAHGELALRERYRLARTLRASYQQAIVLPNSFKSALIPYFAGIAKRTGFRGEMRFGLINDMRRLDRKRLPRTVDRFAVLGRDAESPSGSASNATPLPSSAPAPSSTLAPSSAQLPNPALRVDANNARACAARLGIDFVKPTLALMPGSAFGKSKRWSPDYFSDVATNYLDQGWQVWVFGSDSDVTIGDAIQRATSGAAVNLCGKTQLTDAVDLLAQTQLAITNDSGLMHIAAAVGVPIVAIYGSTSPDFTPPMSARSVKMWRGVACSPCYQRVCRYGHYRCLTEITPKEVLNQSRHLIGDLVMTDDADDAQSPHLVVCDTNHDAIMHWIAAEGFKRYEDPLYKVETAVSGRVSVYMFHLEAADKDVVMKVSAINPSYKLSRRVELVLRRLLRGDHNAAAFKACRAWSRLNVPVCRPIAFWSRGLLLSKKTYFMYEKIRGANNGETVLRTLQASANPDARRCCDALYAKMFAIIRHIHQLGWRHGDPVPKNFLFDLPAPVDELRAEQIDGIGMHLIDYDGAHKAVLKLPWLKRFFDLRDLRGFLRLGLSEEQTLEKYGVGDPSPFWQAALRFWVRRE